MSSVMSAGEPPLIVGGVSSPGKIVVKGTPLHSAPLQKSRDLDGVIYSPGESRRQVSVRPNPAYVARIIRETKLSPLRPIFLATPKIPSPVSNSAAVVKPPGWKAQPPTYPPKLGDTPTSVKPESLNII